MPFKSGVVLLLESFQFPHYMLLHKDDYSFLACKHGHLDFLSLPLQATNNLFLFNFVQTIVVRNMATTLAVQAGRLFFSFCILVTLTALFLSCCFDNSANANFGDN